MKKYTKKFKKLKKNVKGITLIALVVTIIVLLILAGIALNLTIGENGLFTRAENAANTWQMAEQNEQNAMNSLASWIDENLPPEPIGELEGNIAYADFTGDGVADGIIFADLAEGNRGDGEWGQNGWGKYTIPTETNLKQYYVVDENYTEPKFGGLTGQLIAPIKGTSGEDRFYVMALEDIDDQKPTWWANANGNLDTNYNVSYDANDFAVSGAEPTGLINTRRMMECYKNENINETQVNQGTNDMWGIIEEKYKEGWFVPSKSEWAAFGGEVLEPNNITSSYYDDYRLSLYYWSSSQCNAYTAYLVFFDGDNINYTYVNSNYYVRLSTTF